VNESLSEFAPVGKDIRFGLSAIKNVGENVVDSLINSRIKHEKFNDFFDFLNKVESTVCSKRVIESLIKAGAFDSLGHSRKGLLSIHIEAVDSATESKKAEAIGQYDLFGSSQESVSITGTELIIPTEEWDKAALLNFERQMLGLYVSDHPLLGIEHLLSRFSDTQIADIAHGNRNDADIVTVAGLVTNIQRKVTKQGANWAIVTLEDLAGSVDLMVFSQTYANTANLIYEDAILSVRAKIDAREEESPRLVALEFSVPDLNQQRSNPVVVKLNAAKCTPPMVDSIKSVLQTHPGTVEVHLHIINGEKTTVMKIDERLKVEPTSALFGELKALLGPSAVA
jgi:DNA polymerase-3 subunit alpha